MANQPPARVPFGAGCARPKLKVGLEFYRLSSFNNLRKFGFSLTALGSLVNPPLHSHSIRTLLRSIADPGSLGQTLEHLIKALPAILRAGGNSEEVAEAAAVAAWKHVAGTALSRQAVATKLSTGTLVVAVSDSIWQKQLESMRAPLRQRLNGLLGQVLVKRLEFRIDPAALKVLDREASRQTD